MTKSGSTALQFTLSGLRPELKKLGILYPTVKTHATGHHFLASLIRPKELPRSIAGAYAGNSELLKKDIEKSFVQLKHEIKSSNPHTVILSSEMLFKGMNSEHAYHLKRHLLELTNDITVVVCIRQPSQWYLSSQQQKIKASGKFLHPQAVLIKEDLQACTTMFDGKVEVIKFERESLKENDISCEFFHRYIPDAYSLLSSQTAQVKNESSSAESMQILQTYRQIIHPDLNEFHMSDSTLLQHILRTIEEKEDLYHRPSLVPEVAKYIDSCSTDFLWLKEKYGVEFDGMDYTAIQENKNNPYSEFHQVSDICNLDENIMHKLTMHVLAQLLLRQKIPIPNKIKLLMIRNSGNRWVQWLRPLIDKIRQNYVT